MKVIYKIEHMIKYHIQIQLFEIKKEHMIKYHIQKQLWNTWSNHILIQLFEIKMEHMIKPFSNLLIEHMIKSYSNLVIRNQNGAHDQTIFKSTYGTHDQIIFESSYSKSKHVINSWPQRMHGHVAEVHMWTQYLLSVSQFQQSSNAPHDRENEELLKMFGISWFGCVFTRDQTLENIDCLHDIVALENLTRNIWLL